jgi:hypothetical protein
MGKGDPQKTEFTPESGSDLREALQDLFLGTTATACPISFFPESSQSSERERE